ncbi:tapasin-related protein [Neosynchiropus ocellatus]
MLTVALFGCLVTVVSAAGVADVVLSCSLVEEASALGGGAGTGSPFSRTPATLVLKDIPVSSEEDVETLTPFVPPSVPDPAAIMFETKVSSPEIPNAEVLLHADCDDLEVVCEISSYSPRGSSDRPGAHFFMASINVGEADFSSTLILQTLAPAESFMVHPRLDLPLSRAGTLLTEVVFLMFTHTVSIPGSVSGDAHLHCGFLQKDKAPVQEVDVDWRLQHRGRGVRILEAKARSDDLEGGSTVIIKRSNSSIDAAQVVSEGNASLSLSGLKVSDQGTYICSIAVGRFYGQQVVQLRISQPPAVSLSEDSLVQRGSPQTLSCNCRKYFPLDVQMEWSSQSPTDSEPVVLADQGSLSSHQQHGDGTFTLSSRLTVRADVPAGTKITCTVSHSALDSPVSLSVLVQPADTVNYLGILGFLIITGLFFYQFSFFSHRLQVHHIIQCSVMKG